MAVSLISEARQLYEGKVVLRGERFVVKTEAEARDLIAMHFASRDAGEEEPAAGRYARRDMRAVKSKG